MNGPWIPTLLLLGALNTLARAELQIDLEPAAFAGDAVLQAAQADIGPLPGENWFEAEVTGPSGFPSVYHLVWPHDGAIPSPQPVHALRLEYGCGDSTLVVPANSLYYIPGPANPPLGPSDLGDFECWFPNDPPLPFSLVSPTDGAQDLPAPVLLSWEEAVDPEGGAVSYEVFLAANSDSLPATPRVGEWQETQFLFEDGAEDTAYIWSIRARDEAGRLTWAGETWQFGNLDLEFPPELDSIPDQQMIEETSHAFRVTAEDPDGDSLAFSCTVLQGAMSCDVSAEPGGRSAWLSLLPSLDFYGMALLEVRAMDPAGNASELEIECWVENVNDPPQAFELVYPADGAVVQHDSIRLDWQDAQDPDPLQPVYTLYLSDDEEQLLDHIHADSLSVSHAWVDLPHGGPWYWTVRATGSEGEVLWAPQAFQFRSRIEGVLSGDATLDFGPASQVAFDDGWHDVELPPEAPPEALSGWDFQFILAEGDPVMDRVFIGLDFEGEAGDADGDGDPGATADWLAANGGVDRDLLAGSESICVGLDFDQDGVLDLVAGVPAGMDQGSFQVAYCTGGDLPVSFGEPLPDLLGDYAIGPDFVFSLHQFYTLLDPGDFVACFDLHVYSGSLEDDGIGEDHAIVELCLTTRIADAQDSPIAFGLQPIHPNPFNPQTLVPVVIQETGPARVVVHDAVGRQVSVLHDGMLASGRHELRFDGRACASGVYFVSLEAEGRRSTRKMLLLR